MYFYRFKNELGEEIDFSPLGEIIALNVEGISGHDIDIATSKGVNQIGDTVTNTNVNSKMITINGVIIGNLYHNRKALFGVIRPQLKGTLYCTNEQNETFRIDVVAKKTPVIDLKGNAENFQIVFYADYPYWKIDKMASVDIRKLIPMFRFPKNFRGIWKFSQYQRSEFINIENKGNEKTGLKIVMTAKTIASNPKLLNVKTGEYIKLNYNLVANEVITITTGYNNKKIISSVNGNIFKNLELINSTFLQLDIGDNVFKFTADTNENNIEVVVYYDEVVNSL